MMTIFEIVKNRTIFDIVREKLLTEDAEHYEIGDISKKTGKQKCLVNGKIVWLLKGQKESLIDRNSKVVVTVPKSLGASARKFYVSTTKPVKEGNIAKWSLVEGSEIKCVTIISKGNKIRDVDRLRDMYKDKGRTTKIEDWEKVAGIGFVTNGEKRRKCELHWYQCKNIGKIEFKVKKWIDEK